jgi:predicted TIM-barrel fold metal-dependent hydrolase
VVDSHHHIGTDVDGHENSPTGPSGSYSFCRKVLNGDGVNMGLQEELEINSHHYNWSIPKRKDGEDRKIVTYYPLMKRFGECDGSLAEKYSFSETMALDQIVVFPMHDKYRNKESVEYRASNKLIQKWCEIYPHSLRFLGFGRVNPKDDIDEAMNEITRFVTKGGLRGLKLHPNSEDFLMDDPNIERTLLHAAYMGIPVIFHTTYTHEVKGLYDTINRIIVALLKTNKTRLIPQLKVIVGHCTYQSDDVFLALSHPCIYGELSTLNKPELYLPKIANSVDIKRFFGETMPELKKKFPDLTTNRFKIIFNNKLGHQNWTNKIMLGTDYPYMPVTHTIDLVKTLLHRDRMNMDPMGIQNILGGNILGLVPPKFALATPGINTLEIITNSHRKFVEDLIAKKTKIVAFDPILGNTPIMPMRHTDAIITVLEGGKSYISYLLSSSMVKRKSKKSKLRYFETIRNITDDDVFLEVVANNVCPRDAIKGPIYAGRGS